MSRHGLRLDEATAVLTVVHLHDRIREWVEAVFDASDGNDWSDDGTPLPHLLQRAQAATAQTDFGTGPNLMDGDDALAFFEEPTVAAAFLSETGSDDDISALALGILVNSFEKVAGRAARPAMLWLKGRAHEQVGEVELAEQAFRSAERLDPSWPLTLLSLARLASDRGEAERGLALLRRVGAPADDPLVQLLETFQPSPRPNLARNQPCWCGSGRKYKVCHLHREQLPLEERAAWLYQKAEAHLLEGPFAPLLIAAAQERSLYWDAPDALARAVDDGFVPDAVLFEGGAFEHFLALRGPLLPPDEMLLAQQWLLIERSVHEVVSVRPGESMEWRDVRTGDVHDIRERTASRQVKPGELYCARVVPAGETTQIFGGLEPVSLGERDHLITLLDNDPDPLELVAFLSRRFAPPVLLNTEGEPSVLCDATLRVTDPASLADALDGEYDRHEEGPKDMPVWFEHVTTRGIERIRAELHLHGGELRVHANSEARFDRVMSTIGRLDPSATTLSETREPAGDLHEIQELAGASSSPPAEPIDPASDPAMAAALQEMVLNYERAWLDDSIPALSGYTPRQCAEDPTRRPDLIKLLDSFPEDTGQPGQMSPARLRSALGLG